jgi:hypothetical protein
MAGEDVQVTKDCLAVLARTMIETEDDAKHANRKIVVRVFRVFRG